VVIQNATASASWSVAPYFETHAVGLAYYVVMSVWALFELNMYYEGMRRRKGVKKGDRGSFLVFVSLGIPAWFLLLRSPSMFPGATIHPVAVAYWIGVVVLAIGAFGPRTGGLPLEEISH